MKSFEISLATDPDLVDTESIVLFQKNFIPPEFFLIKLTSERAVGVFELASKIGGDDYKRSGVYLRASLGELVSMEETLKVDFPENKPLKLNELQNTLLHILRELRNYQFHLKNLTLDFNESESTIIKEGYPNFFLGPFKTQWTIIDNLELNELLKLKNLNKNYTKREIEHMIFCMNKWQQEYSIQSLILKGLKFYTTEILNHYSR
jgi:hypothetical protein